MYIRKVSFQGIKAISEPVSFDFTPSNTSTFLSENIEDFGIEKYPKDFRVLKQVALIGLNSAGKTSALKGMQIGMALLANPFSAINVLRKQQNLFWDKPFKWEYEFVTAVENKVAVARKYFVTLEINRGEVVHELVRFTEVSKTGVPKDIETIYELRNGKLNTNGKKYNHNMQSITFFSLARTGQIVDELKKSLEKFEDLFLGIDWINDEPQNSNNPFIRQSDINIPKDESYLKKMNAILKAFDPKFISIRMNNMNEMELKIKQGNETKEITGVNDIENILSNGTFTFLRKNTLLFKAMTSRSIVFMDEMDASYHSGLFTLLLEVMRKHSRSQIIITTHSPDIFNNFLRYDQVYLIKSTKNIVITKRVSDFDEVEDNKVSIKKIKRAIRNNPNVKDVMKVIDEFEVD